MPEITKWEYITWNAGKPGDGEALDSYGQDGWELVAAIGFAWGVHYIFKRPVR